MRYALFSRGTARQLAEMRVRAQRSAAMSCACCGETEADGAIFDSADGSAFGAADAHEPPARRRRRAYRRVRRRARS